MFHSDPRICSSVEKSELMPSSRQHLARFALLIACVAVAGVTAYGVFRSVWEDARRAAIVASCKAMPYAGLGTLVNVEKGMVMGLPAAGAHPSTAVAATVYATDGRLPDYWIEALRLFPIRHLRLVNADISTAELAVLADSEVLQTLWFERCRFRARPFPDELSLATDATELSLIRCEFPNVSFVRCPRVSWLSCIEPAGLTAFAFEELLDGCDTLRHVTLTGEFPCPAWPLLADCDELTVLEADLSALLDDGATYRPSSWHESLRDLTLLSCNSSSSAKCILADLTSLERLWLSGSGVDDDVCVSTSSSRETLRSIMLGECHLSEHGLRALLRYPRLESIRLRRKLFDPELLHRLEVEFPGVIK